MIKHSVNNIRINHIKRRENVLHRSRRKRKVRSEERFAEEKIPSSTINQSISPPISPPNRNLLPKSNISSDRNQRIQQENSSSIKQIQIEGKEKLTDVDDLLTKTHKKPSSKSFFKTNLTPMLFILSMIVLLLLVVCGILLPIMLILYPMSTIQQSSSSSSLLNTTTGTSTTSTTGISTTSTSTSTAATVTITSNVCTATWTGIAMIYSCRNCSYYPIYYIYSYNYTAIASTTRIAFSFQGKNGYFALDDISVRNAASPNTEILINGGFEMGNLVSWNICDLFNTSTSVGVKSNSSNFTYLGFRYYSRTGSFFYVGGSSNSTEYISQTFSSIIGNLYLVTFAGMCLVNGSTNGADFFLGV